MGWTRATILMMLFHGKYSWEKIPRKESIVKGETSDFKTSTTETSNFRKISKGFMMLHETSRYLR